MSRFLSFRKHPVRILFLSIAVLCSAAMLRSGTQSATRSPSPASTPSPTTCPANHQCWKVDITFSSGSPDTVGYKIVPDPSTSKCKASITLGKGDLQICSGDIVRWQIHTDFKTASGHMVISQSNSILADRTYTGVPRIEADEETVTSDPGIRSDVGNGTYEYCVIAYDKNYGAQHVYVDDPKIIVGGGRVSSTKLANDIGTDANILLKRAIKNNKQQEVNDLNDLLKILTDIKQQLKIQ